MADPKIRYDIAANVTGDAEVDALARRFEALADTLDGDLKTKAQLAAAALRELAGKSSAVDTFVALKQRAQDAAQALDDAQFKAQAFARSIAAQGEPTRTQTAQLAKLRDAVGAAKQEIVESNTALTAARGTLTQYGISTDGLAEKQRALRQSLAAAKAEASGMVADYGRLATGARAAGQAQADGARTAQAGLAGVASQLRTLQTLAGTALGGSLIGSLVKDVAATADEYANLGARIKLVTGEGAAFDAAFEGVRDVALRTNAELEGTATLFARITQAGKDAGLSSQDAATQALALTETINQSVALSGASADASKAAITQLIQGLQSGVLRGEEFNSVMEQSPRLARALADGLGVTTGELRKMAEQGRLTSATVISALQGQSETLQREFSQLPQTVGRAIQNLSTAWTVYIGEADKGSGASRSAAEAIGFLAKNLDTVIGLLLDAGQAAAAFAAIRLAQQFTGIGVAAGAAAVQVGASNAALAATGASAAGAAATVGRFASILSTLKLFSLVGIVSNFKDIGTAIGEGTAKLFGFKDGTEQLAQAEKVSAAIAKDNAEQRLRMAAATQAAIDKGFELSKSAAGQIATFDELRKKGDSASEAIGKIGKDFDLANSPGIRDAGAVLDKLAADGKLSAEEVRAAWAKALDGQDLARFEVLARNAFAGSAREAERMGAVFDASVREAVKRTGLDFEQLQGKVSATTRSALNDVDTLVTGFDRLKAQGVDTGRALAASLAKAIDTASSQQAIDAVRERVESLRGKLGETVTNGLLDQAKQKATELTDALEKATPGIQSVGEALKQLGITSDAALKDTAAGARTAYETIRTSGTGSAREVGEAFRKAAEAAIAANNGIAPVWVESEAAVRGYTVQVDAAGKTTLRSTAEATRGVNELGQSFGRAGAAAEAGADRAVTALERQTAAAKRAREAAEGAAEEERRRIGVDKEGFSANKDGSRITAGGDLTTLTGIAAFLKAAGVGDDNVARNIAREFADSRGNVQYSNNPGQLKYGGQTSTISEALLKAAERYTFGVGGNIGGAATIPPQNSPRTININIAGGGSGTVRVADEESANTLERLLRELREGKANAR